MKKKIISSIFVALTIVVTSSISVYAAMPNGTVVIGSKSFALAYANDTANVTEITNAIIQGGAIYVKDFSGTWIDNSTGRLVIAGVVPGEGGNQVTAVAVSSVSLNKTIDSLIIGGTDNLVATVNPTDATNKNITWISSDKNVAIVDNTGKVTAVTEGAATVTVTTADGSKLAACKITVTSSILTAKQILGKYGDAVVYIEVSDINHKAIASGSGFIVNASGMIVTNFHVIKGCSYASVTLQNGTKYDVKSVLNYNEKQDIAVLQLSNAANLSIAKLGDSNTVETGDNVVAIGSPQGFENTLSTGIISGINRKSDRGTDIQTTASITHGSSGGALFDEYGNLIGITYAGYDTAGDIGFVIPINEVKPFLNTSNEQTLIQVNSIQVNTAKFFQSLSDVPQPTNTSYYKEMSSADGTYVFYLYSPSTVPSDFLTSYSDLLEKNGWVFYKEGVDDSGAPYTTFVKGNYLIIVSFNDQDMYIMGEKH